MASIKQKLSYANVVSTLALVAALAGGSTAIAIGVANNSVTTKSIKAGNVTANDLAAIRVVNSGNGDASHTAGGRRASCAAKERLIGGGARGNPTNLPTNGTAVESSYPDGNSWVVVKAKNVGGGGDYESFAICLKAKPGL